MTVEEYFGDWKQVIDLQQADSLMRKLSVLSYNNSICPQLKDIFKAFHLCPLNNLRVVIIGQDPYPQLRPLNCDSITVKTPIATGLAFANSPDTPEDSYSPSLEILRESVIDFTIPHRRIIFDPSLEKWEEQGVLLLNSALSCQAGQPSSHTLLWKPFMTSFLSTLSKHASALVYVLMGNQAQSLEPYINPKLNYIIRCRHPSWYARQKTRMPSDIWKQIDNILIGMNGYGIQWFQEEQ